jgi:acetolactate synthase-1/2/3 large subunit
MIKVSDYVVSFLASIGVRHVFLLPGGGSMHLVDSVGRDKRLSYVVNLHEQASAIAAEAYAQGTNHLGVALVTTGPGGTNAITGLAAAWLDSTPCLFISGQVKREDLTGTRGVRQFGFQELPIIDIVRPVTKYAITIVEPESIRFHLEKAYSLATVGRPGPVWVDIPLDVQGALIDESTLEGFIAPTITETSVDMVEPVTHALELLSASERPVVLIGNGVRLAKAERELAAAIERLGVPVLTTWKALDLIPEDHPFYVGRPGGVGQRAANFAQQNSDWLLSIGARLDLGQTGYSHERFAAHARKIVVDVDPAEIRKLNMAVDVAVVADAKRFLTALLSELAGLAPCDRSDWIGRCQAWKARYPVILPQYWEESSGVNLYALVDTFSEELQDGDVFAPGSSGACSEVAMQAFRMLHQVRVFNSEGLGSMGFGIPSAIGACLASGGSRTVCLDGDGGFWMNIQDLETVVRLNLPVKFFVLNNNGYGSIRSTQMTHFGGTLVGSGPESGLTLPDIRSVCGAFGVKTFYLDSHADLRQKVHEILASEGPAVCEVLVSPNQMTAPRLSSRRLPDGRMESSPLEDLWPFLDRDEFRANMRVSAKDGDK